MYCLNDDNTLRLTRAFRVLKYWKKLRPKAVQCSSVWDIKVRHFYEPAAGWWRFLIHILRQSELVACRLRLIRNKREQVSPSTFTNWIAAEPAAGGGVVERQRGLRGHQHSRHNDQKRLKFSSHDVVV